MSVESSPAKVTEPVLLDEAFAIYYDGSEGHSAGFTRLHVVDTYPDEETALAHCQRAAYTPRKVYIYDSPINPTSAIQLHAARFEKIRLLNPRMFAEVCKANITSGVPFDSIIDMLDENVSNLTEVIAQVASKAQ